MIWGHSPPPPQASVGELYIQVVERQIGGGSHFVREMGWDGLKSYDSSETLVILKVHKIEIFFGFHFEICIISLLVLSKY